MASASKNDIVLLDIILNGEEWRAEKRKKTLKSLGCYRSHVRTIKFKKPQNRKEARLSAERISKHKSVRLVRCVCSNGGYI